MPVARLVGVDWGTSSLRAYLLGPDGAVLDRRACQRGILTVEDGDFASVLADEIGGWLSSGGITVLLSGMIGSRQGWIEAPYVDAPAGIGDLAGSLIPVVYDAIDVRVVPGMRTTVESVPDVMRGEEVQVFGALAWLGADEGRFVLPGTHSKWVAAQAGRVESFATYMTGDIYAALREHTILAPLMRDGEGGRDAFDHGVREGARAGTPGALLHRLFGVRTAGLFGRFSPAELPDYLSGLLIGAEIADQQKDARPVHIVASGALAERYSLAAASLGMAAGVVPADSIAGGYAAIARLAKLL